MQVEIAPLLTAQSAYDGPEEVMNTARRYVVWEDRAKVVVDVTLDTTLGTVVDRGAELLGLRVNSTPYYNLHDFDAVDLKPSDLPSDIRFHNPSLSAPFGKIAAILNDDGSAQWWFSTLDLSMEQLLAAHSQGLVDGDPYQVYLVLDKVQIEGGNGADYWFDVVRALPYLKPYFDQILTGLISAGLVTAASVAIKKFRTRWDDTGGDLKRYQQLFAIPRNTKQAATLLRIPEDQATVMLQFLGFEQHRDGYWRPINRPEQKDLVELVSVLNTAAHWYCSADELMEGLTKVLDLPAGERAKRADGIFRKIKMISAGSKSSEEDYVISRRDGRADQFDVVQYRPGGESRILGTLAFEPDDTISVSDDRGRNHVDGEGKDLRFSSIDDAAKYLRGRFPRR